MSFAYKYEESWVSDHPLVYGTFTMKNGTTVKIGTFNVLSDEASKYGKNSDKISESHEMEYLKLLGTISGIKPDNVEALKNFFINSKEDIDQNTKANDQLVKIVNGLDFETDYPLLNAIKINDLVIQSSLQKSIMYLIDEVLNTNSMGGFEIYCNNIKLFIEYKDAIKRDFLIKTIQNYFSDADKAILVCPEFDYEYLNDITKNNSLFNSIQGGIGTGNNGRIVFYKNLALNVDGLENFESLEDKLYKLEFNISTSTETDILRIYSYHGKATAHNKDESIKSDNKDYKKKIKETEKVMECISNLTSEQIKQNNFLVGDYNFPMFHGKKTDYNLKFTSTKNGKQFKVLFDKISLDSTGKDDGSVQKIRGLTTKNAQCNKVYSRKYTTDFIGKIEADKLSVSSYDEVLSYEPSIKIRENPLPKITIYEEEEIENVFLESMNPEERLTVRGGGYRKASKSKKRKASKSKKRKASKSKKRKASKPKKKTKRKKSKKKKSKKLK